MYSFGFIFFMNSHESSHAAQSLVVWSRFFYFPLSRAAMHLLRFFVLFLLSSETGGGYKKPVNAIINGAI